MIWVAWRQHRTECLLMSEVLAVLAGFLLLTGSALAQSAQQMGLTDCLANSASRGCGDLGLTFTMQSQAFLQIADFLVIHFQIHKLSLGGAGNVPAPNSTTLAVHLNAEAIAEHRGAVKHVHRELLGQRIRLVAHDDSHAEVAEFGVLGDGPRAGKRLG